MVKPSARALKSPTTMAKDAGPSTTPPATALTASPTTMAKDTGRLTTPPATPSTVSVPIVTPAPPSISPSPASSSASTSTVNASPKRKRLLKRDAKVAVLPLSAFESTSSGVYVFKLESLPAQLKRERQFVNKERKTVTSSVFNFHLYDLHNKSFEGTAWNAEADRLIKAFTDAQLPAHFIFSNVWIKKPKDDYAPPTDYKNLQLLFTNKSTVEYTPGAETTDTKRAKVCTCSGPCDRSCSIETPSEPWKFSTLGIFLKTESSRLFKWIVVEIVSDVDIQNGRVSCTITDGVHKAFYSGPFVNNLVDGVCLRLNFFEATYNKLDKDESRLLLTCPDASHVVNLGSDDGHVPYDDDDKLIWYRHPE